MSPERWWVLSMLFLLNDVVFDLDEASPVTPGDARRFENLELDYALELGCELFSEDPMLHLNDPQRARRLAWLAARSGCRAAWAASSPLVGRRSAQCERMAGGIRWRRRRVRRRWQPRRRRLR